MTSARPIPVLLAAALLIGSLAACGGSSTTTTPLQPNAARTASQPTAPATPSSATAPGQATAITALANRVDANLTPVAKQCESTSHTQADFVSCLNAPGVHISKPTGAQVKLNACLKQAHDATALGKCAKLTGAP